MKYPLLIPTIGHGSTDLIDFPVTTILIHSSCFFFIKYLDNLKRKSILIISSIIHISRDIPFSYSLLMHTIWFKKPIIAKLYFALFHTPLHYTRTLLISNKKEKYLKIIIALITTQLSILILNNNIDLLIDSKLGEFWWVAPIVGHIILNEYMLYQRHSLLKQKSTTPIKELIII